jgi:uncharacterized protein
MQAGYSHYVQPAGMLSLPLDGGWHVSFNPKGPVGVTVLNAPAQQVLAGFRKPMMPEQVLDRVPGISPDVVRGAIDSMVQIGLLSPVHGAPRPHEKPTTLSAWLHVTQACNLDCAYCYVHKHPGPMDAEIGYTAVDRLAETALHHGYSRLKLKYAGGEPTLNFPLIQAIHARAARRAAETGLCLEEVVLTNGVEVADGVLDCLVQAGMRLMVSLDGGAETHDRTRARRDGRSTHSAVIDTVDRALARGLRPSISITLTAMNLDGVEGAVAFALDRGLPFNLNFYRECSPAEPAGSPTHEGAHPSLVPAPDRLIAAMLRIFSLIRAYPTYPLSLTSILDRSRLDVPHEFACSAGRDYLVVDTNGQVSACQMLMDEPWADLAQEDPLAVVRQHGQDVFRPVEEHLGCRACVWRTACSGGCPLMRNSSLHERYCRVYRMLFPELIRLEGFRLVACQP